MKALALLIAAGLLSACQRDLPTASSSINDALDRIVPDLSSTAAAPLASSLTTLLATVDEGPVDGAALAVAMHHVMQYEQATDTYGAELEVIRLALATMQN
jgi:hypothetical protein